MRKHSIFPLCTVPDSSLANVQAAEFLYETSLFPERTYTFKHALTHEVAYGGLLRERQRLLHGRIVAAIEQHDADQRADQVERLAHHALRGEVWDKAVAYLRQAGDKALARSASREAMTCFEQALVALEHLPEGRERDEQAIDVRFGLCPALGQQRESGSGIFRSCSPSSPRSWAMRMCWRDGCLKPCRCWSRVSRRRQWRS